MKQVESLKKRWNSGIVGKLTVGAIVLVGCCLLSAVTNVITGRTPAGSAASPRATRTPWKIATAGPTETPLPPTAAPEPTPTLSPDESAKQTARDVCTNRFVSASIDGGMLVVCKVPSGFKDSDIAFGAVYDFINTAKGAYAAKPDLTYVTMQFTGTFIDKTGNEHEQPAFKMHLTAAQFAEINWKNMNVKRLANLMTSEADSYELMIHPAMAKAWIEFLADQ
jgi:hypothetical protein